MSKWIAEFDLEDGDTMPEHMDLEYKGVKLDFHCRPMWIPCTPETMPKMTDVYLVKVRINKYGEGMYPTFRTALWHTASRKWFVHESENSIIGEVTAWMPIPWEGEWDES